MSKAKTNERNKTLRKLFGLIDSNVGAWKDKEAQDEAIKDFLEKHPLTYLKGKKDEVAHHDAESARGLLVRMAHNYRLYDRKSKTGQTGISDLFERGTSIFKETFLEEVGYEREDEDTSDEESSESTTEKPKSPQVEIPADKERDSKKTNADIRSSRAITTGQHDTSDEDDNSKQEKRRLPKIANSGVSTKEDSGKGASTGGRRGMKRPFDQSGAEENAASQQRPKLGDEFTTAGRSQGQPTAPDGEPTSSHFATAEEIESEAILEKKLKANLDSDVLTEPMGINPPPESRRVTVQELNAGCDKAPRYNSQQRHLEKILQGGYLFPPELREHTKTARGAGTCRTLAHFTLEEDMRHLYLSANESILNWCYDHELARDVDARFVQNPEPELAKLYAHLFGAEDWKSRLVELQQGEKKYRLDAVKVVTGLVGSHLYRSVFTKAADWDIEKPFEQMAGPYLRHFRQALDDKGHYLEEFLKQVRFKIVNDEAVQNTVIADKANELASDLIMTLAPHMKLMKRASTPESADVIDNPSADTQYVQSLRRVFKSAFILKGKMEAAWEAKYEFVWHEPGSGFIRQSVWMPDQTYKPKHDSLKIVYTIWPAIRATIVQPVPDGDDETKVEWASPAQALMRYPLEITAAPE